jgi:hypothetical protein
VVYRRRWLALSCLLGASLLPVGWLGAVACGNAASLIVKQCSDIDAGLCFSNDDCSDPSFHCGRPDASDPSTVVICCVPGDRGTGDAGSMCTSADDCATAVCAYTTTGRFCSKRCQTPADCPSNLPSCFDAGAFVDGGAAQLWCGP